MSIEDWEDGRDQAGGKARQGMARHGTPGRARHCVEGQDEARQGKTWSR